MKGKISLAIAGVAAAIGLTLGLITLNRWRTEQLAHQAEEARYARFSKSAPAIQPPAAPEPPPLPKAISPQERAEIIAAAQFMPPDGTTAEYTWTQIDRILAAVRGERKKRPQATAELMAWYDHLASLEFTLSTDFDEHLKKLDEWCDTVPNSPTPHIVKGRALIQHAWFARGWGPADTVAAEDARLFKERLAEAQHALARAAALGPLDGEAIAAQIIVAKGIGTPKSEVRDLLDQGMQLDPSYSRTYTAMAEYLLPRWHGNPGEVERLANEVATELGGDDGLDAFAQIAFIVNRFNLYLLFDGEYNRKLLAKSARVLVRRYAYDPDRVAFAAMCAYAAQDHATARWVVAFLPPDEPITRVPGWTHHVQNFRQWCEARKIPDDHTNFVWGSLSQIGKIAFDPDSQSMWTGNGGSNHPVRLLSATSGRRELALKGPRGSINDISVDGERRRIAALLMGEQFRYCWVLWDRAAPDEPRVTMTEKPLMALALNPKFPQLAIGFSHHVDLLDLETDKVTYELKAGDAARHQFVQSLKYSSDGSRLAINTKVYDTRTGEQLLDLAKTLQEKPIRVIVHRLIGFDGENRALGIATEPKLNAAESLMRFSMDGKREIIIEDLGKHAYATAISPDCRLLAIAGETRNKHPQGISVWDLVTGKRIKDFGGHWRRLDNLVFSPNGKQLASSDEGLGLIKFWSLDGIESPVAVSSGQ